MFFFVVLCALLSDVSGFESTLRADTEGGGGGRGSGPPGK